VCVCVCVCVAWRVCVQWNQRRVLSREFELMLRNNIANNTIEQMSMKTFRDVRQMGCSLRERCL
jgi:hypothetical protein